MSESLSFEGFTGLNLSLSGLLGLAILLVLLGGLIPKYVVNQIRQDRDARLAEAREEITNWRKAYQTSEESRSLLSQQVGELLELGKTTDSFIRSLQIAAQRNVNP